MRAAAERKSRSQLHGGDEAKKGEKTEDKLETANSDESENRSEETDSVRMFGSETPNQPNAK